MTTDRKWRLHSGILVIAGVAFAGVAFATIPDADGVIHGCVDANSGRLRAIDYPAAACLPNEAALTWNVMGQTGQMGPQGPPGPSHAYAAHQGDTVVLNDSGEFAPIVQVTVPPGTYAVAAKAVLAISTTSRVGIECDLRYEPQGILFGDASAFTTSQDGNATLPLLDARTLDVETTIAVECAKGPAGNSSVRFSSMVATQVGGLN